MSLFRRYVSHPTAGTGGNSALLASTLPLDAGRMTIAAANALHLCEQNAVIPLRQHPGFREFFAAAPTGETGSPSPADIPWSTSWKDGAAWADLGLHYVWQRPGGRWPRITLSLRAKVDGASVAGVLLGLAPGDGGPDEIVASTGDVIASPVWSEKRLSLDLELRYLGDVSLVPTNGTTEAPTGERVVVRAFRAWFGGYCSGGVDTSGERASAVALSLVSEAP